MKDAGIIKTVLEAIAVTYAPGLIGALLVGVNFAKGLALALGVPLVPVHHISILPPTTSHTRNLSRRFSASLFQAETA